jgi:hypothetical protein
MSAFGDPSYKPIVFPLRPVGSGARLEAPRHGGCSGSETPDQCLGFLPRPATPFPCSYEPPPHPVSPDVPATRLPSPAPADKK